MPEIDKLKRQMLREAVRENVELRDEKRYLRRRFGGRRWRTVLRVAALVVVPALLFVSVNAISTGKAPAPEVLVVGPGELPASDADATSRAPRAIERSTFRLGVVRVVVDPGHGGGDPGASSPSGLSEKEVTLDVSRRLAALLAADGYEAVLTRPDDRRLTLRERALSANQRRGDLFVSIHVNSAPMPGVRGVETYYLGAPESPLDERLAGAENVESGYSLADFKSLLEEVYRGVRETESRRFAGAVQRGLVEALRIHDPRLTDRGVKSAPFAVLVGTEMPAVLAEIGCLSDDAEAALLARPEHRQAIAAALSRGIRAYAEAAGTLPNAKAPSVAKKGKQAG